MHASHAIDPLTVRGFDAQWIAELTSRGAPDELRDDELRWVGMPVGGLFAGQVYLGGDGRLWWWDIFNQPRFSGHDGQRYARPVEPSSLLEQGVELILGERVVPLDRNGFPDVGFVGRYPVGTVTYRDPAVPLVVTLEACSPFIPLDADDSGWPAVVLRYTVENPTTAAITTSLRARLENAVAPDSRHLYQGTRRLTCRHTAVATILSGTAEGEDLPAPRPAVVHEDWGSAGFAGWTVDGSAFGSGPLPIDRARTVLGLDPGADMGTAADHVVVARSTDHGCLTSAPFVIDRRYLQVWIGGGCHGSLEVEVEGQVVATAHGLNRIRLSLTTLALWRWEGRVAIIRIRPATGDPWGSITVGPMLRSDEPSSGPRRFAERSDVGSMALALVGDPAEGASPEGGVSLGQRQVGHLERTLTLPPGGKAVVTFLVTWHFPHLDHLPFVAVQGRWYATRWRDAAAVAEELAIRMGDLLATTRAWRDTWYDSTLPHWFLDRTFSTTSTLATSTCHRLADGRFWAWEGVGSCHGTCGHVWYYAQSLARLFPAIERDQRERIDFGLAQAVDGSIGFRGEGEPRPAIDAQAGYVLRALREHQTGLDDGFLQRLWPRVRLATTWLITQDGDDDGLITGPQHNTLDTDWYGPSAWLSGLYQAALLAAAHMADLVGDGAFAERCRSIQRVGRQRLVQDLFNGEYFQNRPDPRHPLTINSGSGCLLDQVLGQAWAFHVDLPRVFPAAETAAALDALWRHNVLADVGPYRAANPPGRWYAMPGEGGTLLCTFPRNDWDYARSCGLGASGFRLYAAGYFNECMNGFEHQFAAHLLWEGRVAEGLAVERLVHDRYAPAKRNPWNEIECGDHYGRSLASYGVFLAACGFRYDGPQARLGFAPRLTPEDFRAAFTAAEGWGSFHQRRRAEELSAEIRIVRGRLRLRTLALEPHPGHRPRTVTATVAGTVVPATWSPDGSEIRFTAPVLIPAGQTLRVVVA